jgi:UDP-glucose 4-epimerase
MQMKILVTGSAGHLGEGLVKVLRAQGHLVFGLDVLPSPETNFVGSITDAELVDRAMKDINYVIHTATLHKPHVATHSMMEFININIKGTLILLEKSVSHKVEGFIYTSTTSTFGNALKPDGTEGAVWVTEDLKSDPKNIYGVTKSAAEDLCQLFYQDHHLPCIVLRTSRFFQEGDDMKHTKPEHSEDNIKVNEYLFRRVDLQDAVDAHVLAIKHAKKLGFEKFIISATSPFTKEDCNKLLSNAPEIIASYYPEHKKIYDARGWQFFPSVDRVYVNDKARKMLGWEPKYNFSYVLDCVKSGKPFFSPLMQSIGIKSYHPYLPNEPRLSSSSFYKSTPTGSQDAESEQKLFLTAKL